MRNKLAALAFALTMAACSGDVTAPEATPCTTCGPQTVAEPGQKTADVTPPKGGL